MIAPAAIIPQPIGLVKKKRASPFIAPHNVVLPISVRVFIVLLLLFATTLPTVLPPTNHCLILLPPCSKPPPNALKIACPLLKLWRLFSILYTRTI